jgi:hypothetical protein
MCQQALLHYLTARAADIPQSDLALFLRLAERFTDFQAKETKKHADKRLPDSISRNVARLDELLATIAVCDPAIGSGAFPVGMMHEIVRARMALSAVEGMPAQTFYRLKRHAIHHSLYGVDFDPGAVEIAKLRLWLSMVVDEDEIRDIQPLPNLDYKIMQGNSLLEEFDGIRLLDDKLLQPPNAAQGTQVAELKARIAKLQAEAIRLHSEERKGAAQKLAAEQDIKRLKKQLGVIVNPAEAGAQGELAQQSSWSNLLRLQELHARFFDEDSRAEKDKLRRQLDELEWNFMEATLREQGRETAIAELKRASATHRKPFFLWRLHFAEVFQQRGGFDVVIANPPYVRHEEIKEFKPAFERNFACYTGVADLYVYFFERSVKLLRDGGALSFITSNKYFRSGYGRKLRELLAQSTRIRRIIDFGELPVFAAGTDPAILIVTNDAPGTEHLLQSSVIKEVEEINQLPNIIATRSNEQLQTTLQGEGWTLENSAVLSLLAKLRRVGKPLNDVVAGRFYYGIKTGLNEAFVVDRATRDRLIAEHRSSAEVLKPFVHGSDANKWTVDLRDDWLVYIPWHFPLHLDTSESGVSDRAESLFKKNYPAIYTHLLAHKPSLLKRNADETGIRYEWYALQRWGAEYWQEFKEPKIIFNETSKELHAFFDETGLYTNKTLFMLIAPQPKPLLAVLLSRTLDWLFRHEFPSWGDPWKGGRVQFRGDRMATVPIPDFPPKVEHNITHLVDRILSAKQRDAGADVSALERELDELVYALYGLTPEEIKIVEGATK